MSPDPRALVITGDGLNCERETAEALRLAGAVPELVHVSDVPERGLEDFRLLVLIGGFSNGDHLGAGTVQASLFRHRLRRPLERFLSEGRLVLGVCNGFQTLVKMGLLPGADWERTATIMANDSGRFEDRWVHLAVDPSSALRLDPRPATAVPAGAARGRQVRGPRHGRRSGPAAPRPGRPPIRGRPRAAHYGISPEPQWLGGRRGRGVRPLGAGFRPHAAPRGLPLPVQPPLLDPDAGPVAAGGRGGVGPVPQRGGFPARPGAWLVSGQPPGRRAGRLPAAILMSGTGSNARRLLELPDPSFEVRLILTDNPASNAAAIAREHAVQCAVVDIRAFCEPDGLSDRMRRAAYDREVGRHLARRGARLAALAGWDWVVGPELCRAFLFVNVHPGDLRVTDERGRRKYVGLGWVPAAKAMLAGERFVHSTTHLVTPELDGGPIARVSRPVPVRAPARVSRPRTCCRKARVWGT